MEGKELWDLVEGLQTNDLLEYTHLLTGYIGSVSFLETIVNSVNCAYHQGPGNFARALLHDLTIFHQLPADLAAHPLIV